MEQKQTLENQQRLFSSILGHDPTAWDISGNHPDEKLPFHLISIWLFWKLFKRYGSGTIKSKSDSCGKYSLLFSLDTERTGGVEGSFCCKPGSKNKSYYYRLEYFVSDDPDFCSEKTTYFSSFSVTAGYKYARGTKQGLIWQSSELDESEFSISIFGPKFESNFYLKKFEIEFFLVNIIKEHILPFSDWLKRKEIEWKDIHDKVVSLSLLGF